MQSGPSGTANTLKGMKGIDRRVPMSGPKPVFPGPDDQSVSSSYTFAMQHKKVKGSVSLSFLML
jgi:hypothetical protein